MARYFHGGPNAIDPVKFASKATTEAKRKELEEQAAKGYPLTEPSDEAFMMTADGEKRLKVPQMYWQQKTQRVATVQGVLEVPGIDEDSTTHSWKPGSVVFASGSYEGGFYVCEPDGYVDIPDFIAESTVKSICPHLLTEKEALARGIAQPAPLPTAKKSSSKLV